MGFDTIEINLVSIEISHEIKSLQRRKNKIKNHIETRLISIVSNPVKVVVVVIVV